MEFFFFYSEGLIRGKSQQGVIEESKVAKFVNSIFLLFSVRFSLQIFMYLCWIEKYKNKQNNRSGVQFAIIFNKRDKY